MKKFIKKNRKTIIISLILSFVIAHILGYSRRYSAFGGEDLLPLIVLLYWYVKYLVEEETKKW